MSSILLILMGGGIAGNRYAGPLSFGVKMIAIEEAKAETRFRPKAVMAV